LKRRLIQDGVSRLFFYQSLFEEWVINKKLIYSNKNKVED